MAWLEKLDTRAARWSPLWWALYLIIKWSFIGLGGFCWFMLWWQRWPPFGIFQGVLIIAALWGELLSDIRRSSGDRGPDGSRDRLSTS